MQRFIKSEEDDEKRLKPLLFACGGLISTSVSASAVINIASQLAEKTRNQIILFIRDEDGSAKQQPQIQNDLAENHLQQATSSEDGDGLVDVHPEWAKLIYSPGALSESLCVISRLSYSSLLPKCSCAIIDGGHGIIGKHDPELLLSSEKF